MKKVLLGVFLVFGVIMLTGFVLAIWNSSTNEITIPIYKGWNLVPAASGETQKADSPIKVSDFKYAFVYDNDDNKYVLVTEDGQPTQRDFDLGPWYTDTYALQSSLWVYSEKDGNLILRWNYPGFNSQFFELSQYNLVSGWNFIFITPQMKDKSLNEFKGNCDWTSIYSYGKEGSEVRWMNLNNDFLDEKLTDNSIGYGLLIKVNNDCSFEDNVISPPAMPSDSGQSLCSDSDGGLDYSIKGTVTGQNEDGPQMTS